MVSQNVFERTFVYNFAKFAYTFPTHFKMTVFQMEHPVEVFSFWKREVVKIRLRDSKKTYQLGRKFHVFKSASFPNRNSQRQFVGNPTGKGPERRPCLFSPWIPTIFPHHKNEKK